MAINFDVTEWVMLISFLLIYGIFLLYDLFKRGEPYGSAAYVMALLPANYLWAIVAQNGMTDFGALGAMTVLAVLWLLAVIRDIFIKDKKEGFKDADDVALMIIIAAILNIIISAILPNIDTLVAMQDGTTIFWKYFFLPDFQGMSDAAPVSSVIVAYKAVSTLLILSLIVPIVIDLKGTKINMIALLVLVLVFLLPFWFIAFLWSPESGATGVILFLISIIFFIFLLIITRGEGQA